jgi:signal transduction histidine kinase/sensor domain CHASE-containing protein/ActR/RegA family two-component response regulator
MVKLLSIPKRYRGSFQAAALFCLLALIPIGVWSLIGQREDVALRDLTRQYSRNIALQIQGAIDSRVGMMRILAARRNDPKFDQLAFDRVASLYRHEFPGLLLLNWIDKDFILRWVVPHGTPADRLIGEDSRAFPSSSFVVKAAESLQPVASSSFNLLVGGQGFILTFPDIFDGKFYGRTTAVVRTAELMDVALGSEAAPEFEVQVMDGPILMYARNWSGFPTGFENSQEVQVLNRHWNVQVRPTVDYVRALRPNTKYFVLVGGLALALALSLLFWLVQRSKQKDRDLRVAQRRLYNAIEALPVGILLYGPDRKLALWNSYSRELYGPVFESFRVGMPYSELAEIFADQYVAGNPEEKRSAAQAWHDEFENSPGRGEIVRSDGKIIQRVDWRTPDGSTVCLRTDITETRQKDAALKQAQDLLRDAIEGIPAGFLLWDREGNLALWNHVAETVYPGTTNKLRGGLPFAEYCELINPDIEAANDDARQAALRSRLEAFRGDPQTSELALKDGRTIQLIDWRTTDGSTVSIRFDITQAKRNEQEWRQAQRMDALGKLTGGIAHDFNNLLQVILGCTDMLLTMPKMDKHAQELGTQVRVAALRGAELTGRLLAYSRKQALRPEKLDLNRLVLRTSEMLRRTLGEHIQIETVLAGGLWLAIADAAQLENAILNLAVNCRDAMPDGGKLTLETANARLDEAYAAGNPGVQPGQYIMVAVSDTGTGMDAETVERAFEPFFTTKEPGKGTGLGLSMVYGFVKQSGGHIKIYSESDQGTSVKVYLPRAVAGTQQAIAELPDTQLPPRGSETVLVVEDDELVRSTVVGQLKSLGYRVLEAAEAASALRVLEREPGIDLMFTDVVMPGGMMGLDLAKRAQALRPTLRVLFTSGYTENAIVHQGKLGGQALLLPKPYPRDELARKLRIVLDGYQAN